MVEVGWSMHLKSSENKTGMYFHLLILVSSWQLSSHLSPHFLCHGLLQNPEVKFSWAPQRHRHILIFSHQISWSKQSNHVLEAILHRQSPSPEATAFGCKRNKTLEMSQSWEERSVLVLLCSWNTLCNFLTHVEKCWCFCLFNWRNK